MTAPLPDAFRFARVVRFGSAEFRRLMGRQPGECTWCGGPVPKGARTWCSTACVDEWEIRSQPAVARRRIYERDRGVCAVCGADCDARRKRIDDADARILKCRTDHVRVPDEVIAEADAARRDAGLVGEAGAYMIYQAIPALWEADHIVPVCEGGGFCGLDNLRTLCLLCHRAETAALAARRAQARREQPADTGQVALFGGAP